MNIAILIRRFFEFSQNNSGGSFDENEEEGIGTCVIVEAKDWQDANERARAIGIYFNGCDTGRDCSCCGDRWYRLWEGEEGDPVPSSYGRPVWGNASSRYRKGAYIHYLDGTIEHVVFRAGSKSDSFFSDEYFDDAIPSDWASFFRQAKEESGSRGVVIVKIRKMMALAKDQAGKPEGATARALAEELANKYNIDIQSWA
jgi:hypothetical protein